MVTEEVVTKLASSVDLLLEKVSSLTAKIDDMEKARKEEVDALQQDNAALRTTITEMSDRLNRVAWKSFVTPPPTTGQDKASNARVLLGSSVIRDIGQENLDDTRVVCKPGGLISDITAEVDNLPEGYDELTLIVGGNDCDSDPPVPASHIVDRYSTLVTSAKTKAADVRVCAILPRLKSEALCDKIDAVNAGLSSLCEDTGVTFVDTQPSFRLQDGSINDGYFLSDGVHLTRAATNKLAACMDLQINSGSDSAWKRRSPRRKPKSKGKNPTTRESHDATEVDRARSDQDADDWTEVRSRRAPRSRSSSQIRCYYCAEIEHVKGTCRHGEPVKCYTCKRVGHKSKYCHLY